MSRLSAIFNHYKIVREIPVFQALKWFDVQRIAARARVLMVAKGQVIYHEGDPVSGFYCILSGRVRAYRLDKRREKHDVEFFRRGMYFGIISLLTGDAHSMTFEAVNDSRILYIPGKDFSLILKKIPHLGMEFSRSLSRRLQERSKDRKKSLSKVISVYSPARQTGNSTYAFHLAYQIARQAQAKVLLTRITSALSGDGEQDIFDQGGAAPLWERRAGGCHLDEMTDDDERVRSLTVKSPQGVDFLNASFYPDDARVVSRISEFVTARAIDYDYVVVDLPNEQDHVVLKTLVQSDEIHLLARDSADELRMIRRVLDHLEEELREYFDPENIRVVMKTRQDLPCMPFNDIRDILDFGIYARLPFIDGHDLLQPEDFGALRVRFPQPRSLFKQEMVKIARGVSGVRVGLVLGGGAALGIAHIGVLRVLEREDIPVDIIAGSSMGALIASLWATGYDARQLTDIARQFRDQKAMLKLFDPVIPISGILGGRLVKRWLARFLGDKHFFDTRLPVRIVAYDLNNRQELVYDKGRLIDAVRKSISIPGVFEPVVEHSRVIIDGGVLNPVPANVLRQQGVERVIAVNVLQSPDEVVEGSKQKKALLEKQSERSFFQSPLKFLKTRLMRGWNKNPRPKISDIMVQTLLASEYQAAKQASRDIDVMIHPDLSGIQWYELYRVDDLIALGEQAAEKALPMIHDLLKKK